MTNRKLRFNLVDLLILLAAAAAVLFLLYFFVWRGRDTAQLAETQKVNIEYTIEIQKIDPFMKNAVAAGQPVRDAVEQKKIGSVKSVSDLPAQDINFGYREGREVYSLVEDKINLHITVAAEAIETESSFTVDGYEVCVGKLMSVYLPDFQGYGYCIGMKKLS